MGLRNVGDQIKVVTITKVPTREIVEQTRSVAEMANICCSDSVMVSWSMTLVAARGEGFQRVKVISNGRYEPRGSSWFNKAKLACDRSRIQMIVDLPAGTYFWVMIHLRNRRQTARVDMAKAQYYLLIIRNGQQRENKKNPNDK